MCVSFCFFGACAVRIFVYFICRAHMWVPTSPWQCNSKFPNQMHLNSDDALSYEFVSCAASSKAL